MITKEKIRREIDTLKDDYLEILCRINKAFEMLLNKANEQAAAIDKQSAWHYFIEEIYGCLSDAPVKCEHEEAFEALERIANF